jgi:hypothetical protein
MGRRNIPEYVEDVGTLASWLASFATNIGSKIFQISPAGLSQEYTIASFLTRIYGRIWCRVLPSFRWCEWQDQYTLLIGDGKIQSSPNEADDNTKIGVNCSDSSREATLSNSRRARLENRCNYILDRFYLCSTVHNNESGRFKTFVANRIAAIHDHSSPSQWRYVNTEVNPADYASRGLRPINQHEIEQWINGPNFLRKTEDTWTNRPEGINILPDDKLEWKREVEIYETQTDEIKPLDTFIQHYSCWYRLQKGIVWLNRFIKYLMIRIRR